MFKIMKYVLVDVLRSRFLIAYASLLLVTGLSLFYFQGDIVRSLSSLMSIAMFVVPLISIVFATTHYYNSSEFIELMVSQPIRRSHILWGEFAGIALAQLFSVLLGIGIPVLLFSANGTGMILLAASVAVSLIFTSLALLAAMLTRDKAKGIGLSLLFWLYFTVIYDGIVLAILFMFNSYPLEKAVIILMTLNPVDLGRVLVLLNLDISALMGYTGAIYRDFLGTSAGSLSIIVIMLAWVVAPLLISLRVFNKKNL